MSLDQPQGAGQVVVLQGSFPRFPEHSTPSLATGSFPTLATELLDNLPLI